MNTQAYYQYKMPMVTADGDLRYTIPRFDPMQYETSIDFTWDTVAEAEDFLLPANLYNWGIDQEEASDWVLVRVEITLVSDASNIISKQSGN